MSKSPTTAPPAPPPHPITMEKSSGLHEKLLLAGEREERVQQTIVGGSSQDEAVHAVQSEATTLPDTAAAAAAEEEHVVVDVLVTSPSLITEQEEEKEEGQASPTTLASEQSATVPLPERSSISLHAHSKLRRGILPSIIEDGPGFNAQRLNSRDQALSSAGTGRAVSVADLSRHSVSTFRATATRADLLHIEFYNEEGWVDRAAEILFKVHSRERTIKSEVYCGLVHFISCMYVLAVIPKKLADSGYPGGPTVVSVAFCCGIGCVICGLFANLPFVLAPPTVIAIFFTNFTKSHDMNVNSGNKAIIFSGIFLLCFGYRPIAQFVSRLIPLSIQVGTAVGVGLLTALAGAQEVQLVVSGGSEALVTLGLITPDVIITFAGIIIIVLAYNYHVKGAFCIALIFCSLVGWIYSNSWPTGLVSSPKSDFFSFEAGESKDVLLLTGDLLFLYILYLNGLVSSLSELANLTRTTDNAVPRGRWLYLLCGLMTVVSGFFSSAPILISPESTAAIKEGARTGLSTCVCGALFLISVFFSPVFECIPSCGVSPVLIMIGVILFQNVGRIDWRKMDDAAPTFIVLFFIPFTFSILQGVVMGYIVLLIVWLFTGELVDNFVKLVLVYLPSSEAFFDSLPWLKYIGYKKSPMAAKPEEENENNPGDLSSSQQQQQQQTNQNGLMGAQATNKRPTLTENEGVEEQEGKLTRSTSENFFSNWTDSIPPATQGNGKSTDENPLLFGACDPNLQLVPGTKSNER